MTAPTLPRTWQERQADDAELLARYARPEPALPTPAVSIGDAIRGMFVQLGARTAHCDRHGDYPSRGMRVGRDHLHEVWTRCPACVRGERDAAARAEQDAARQATQERLEQALRTSALPPRLARCGFDNYVAATAEQATAVAAVSEYARTFAKQLADGSSLILAGNPGTGKGHLAAALMREIMPAHSALYLTASGLIRLVRGTWGKGAERTEIDVLDDLARVDLLVLDELGVQYGTDAERNLLFDVLDRRYMDLKPSVLVTNLDRASFKALVGERIFDRLRETARWLSFTWPSYRGNTPKENT